MKKYTATSILLFSILFSQNWMQSQFLERKFNQAVEDYNNGKYATSSTILKQL